MEHAYRIKIQGEEFFFKDEKSAIAFTTFLNIGFQVNPFEIVFDKIEIMSHTESYEHLVQALKRIEEEDKKTKLN